MTPEQAIQEIKQGAAARLFERRPYFRAVFTAMSPEDQQSTIATIERETNVPECQLSDIDNWLEDHSAPKGRQRRVEAGVHVYGYVGSP